MNTPPDPFPSTRPPAAPPGAILGAAPHDLFAAGLPTEPPAPASPPPTLESLAPEFPRLELLALVGQGGMGAVYRARQRGLGRDVAPSVSLKNVRLGRAAALYRYGTFSPHRSRSASLLRER